MRIQYINESIQGASHKAVNKKCQDSNSVKVINESIVIAAIADGHGSSKCKYSDLGASFAVDIFMEIAETIIHMNEYNTSIIITNLSKLFGKGKENFIKLYHRKWQAKVKRTIASLKQLDEEHHSINEDDYELFGTTFLGLIFVEDSLFAIQIGDGDITFVNDDETTFIIDATKFWVQKLILYPI